MFLIANNSYYEEKYSIKKLFYDMPSSSILLFEKNN